MGFTVEEREMQLGALLREKEETERTLKLMEEEEAAARAADDLEQAVFMGRRARELRRTLAACKEQLTLVGASGTTKQARATRR